MPKLIIGKDITLPAGTQTNDISDGYHTFGELYDHRILNFIALMNIADKQGLKCGWSDRHDDGELCFGGGWVIAWIVAPSGKQARYHMEANRPLPTRLKKDVGLKWNGNEETLETLQELATI